MPRGRRNSRIPRSKCGPQYITPSISPIQPAEILKHFNRLPTHLKPRGPGQGSSSSRRQPLSSNLIPHPHLYNLIKDIFIHTPVIMNGHCIWAIDPSVALVTRETLDRVLDPRPGEPRPPTFGPEHGQLSTLPCCSPQSRLCPQNEVFRRFFF